MTNVLPRHFLFALADGGGTVPPELGVVRRLVERGHRVHVLADASMTAQVRATGATMYRWTVPSPRETGEPEPGSYRDWELRSPLGLARGMADHMIAGPARRHAEETIARIGDDRPDRVVTSFVSFGAMMAARSEGIPFDVLIPNIYPLPVPGIPPMGTGLRPARNAAGRVRDRLLDALSTRVLGHYALPRLNAVRGELGLPGLRTPWEQVHEARRQFVLSSRRFEFPARFPTSVRHTGPILDDPVWASSEDVELPPGDSPMVLVALSSTYQGQQDTIQNVIDALASLPVRSMVTTGPGLDPEQLRAGDGVRIVRSAPHHVVMENADLVITHGGHGTVMKSLVAGIPMIVMPHGRDQPDNAVRASMCGAALVLSKTASPRRIADAVSEVLRSPIHARAAEQIGSTIREEVARSDLVTELESP